MDTVQPTGSWQTLSKNGITIQWIVMTAGDYPFNVQRDLSVVAALGAGYELDVEDLDPLRCDQNDIYLLPATTRRRSSFIRPGNVLRVSYTDDVTQRAAADAKVHADGPWLEFRRITDPAVYEIIHLLAAEMRPDGARGITFAEALGMALLGQIMRSGGASRDEKDRSGLSPQRLAHCKAFIDEHFTESVTLTQVASCVKMSRFHFARAFKSATGTTPHAYLLERRIAAAKIALRDTDRPLNEISKRLGFSNASHFSRLFSRYSGASPSEYRSRSDHDANGKS
jgi:AraC-like DNA-binding protein